MLLARLLPLIIGDSVQEDDTKWQNYLRLMEIVDIFCPRVTEDDAAYLSTQTTMNSFVSYIPVMSSQ